MADLAEALGPIYELMVHLGTVLGLRWGECAGLRVGRIDFDRSTVIIAEQVTRGAGGQATTEADRRATDRLGDRFLPRRDHDSGRGLI